MIQSIDRMERALQRTLMDRPKLTAEQERELWTTWRHGTDSRERQRALTQLWESHSKLVYAIASRYRWSGIEMADLVSAGQIGLHTGIDRFDPDAFSNRLSTYAAEWIRSHIQDYVARNAATVRLPSTAAHRRLIQASRRLFAEARRACDREGVSPTDGELCDRVGRIVGLSGLEVSQTLRLMSGNMTSLDQTLGDEEGSATVGDMLVCPQAAQEDDLIGRMDTDRLRRRIAELAAEVLTERERDVFMSRCFSGSDDVVHLETLAAKHGVSRERIHQLEASAKRKVMTALSAEGVAVSPEAARHIPHSRAQRRSA